MIAPDHTCDFERSRRFVEKNLVDDSLVANASTMGLRFRPAQCFGMYFDVDVFVFFGRMFGGTSAGRELDVKCVFNCSSKKFRLFGRHPPSL